MIEFQTFEDIVDFAILQEKAAQQFYTKLSAEVSDPQVRLYYRTLAEEERLHEQELRKLKTGTYKLAEPDVKMLQKSGYLEALPARADMTLPEAIRYSLKKEKSARMLYSTLAGAMKNEELAMLFRTLADQEQLHAEYFQKELEREMTHIE
jgi:rubrerythrin